MRVLLSVAALCLSANLPAQTPLNAAKLTARNVHAAPASYNGRNAVRITDAAASNAPDGDRYAIVPRSAMQDGTIDVDVSGDTAPNADPQLRGFVGIAFRVSEDASHYECIYLRPKNGRSADQLQRNHSTQYISVPGYPWQQLRAETPGKYESYVDLAPGKWTHMRIVVAGSSARLYVNSAPEPVLIVSDLKQAPSPGLIALWIGPGTIAHFANLRIAPAH